MRKALLLIAAITLAACSSGPKPLPRPDGVTFRLNPDRWAETVNDVPMLREASR